MWAEWAAGELLVDVSHRQVVFTIPKCLRVYFRCDRALLGDLVGCAWRALTIWVLDCFDDLLSWHHSRFSVHGEVRAPHLNAAARVGRYMIRCPLMLDHLPAPG
jgi:hypothetical protein